MHVFCVMETEQELIHLYEAMKRAADDAVADGDLEFSPAENRCLDGLEQLEKFPVNYHLLVSTQVRLFYILICRNYN